MCLLLDSLRDNDEAVLLHVAITTGTIRLSDCQCTVSLDV